MDIAAPFHQTENYEDPNLYSDLLEKYYTIIGDYEDSKELSPEQYNIMLLMDYCDYKVKAILGSDFRDSIREENFIFEYFFRLVQWTGFEFDWMNYQRDLKELLITVNKKITDSLTSTWQVLLMNGDLLVR